MNFGPNRLAMGCFTFFLGQQRRAEYQQQRSAQQPAQSKLVTTEYMQRQLALVEQTRKFAEDRKREAVEQNLD